MPIAPEDIEAIVVVRVPAQVTVPAGDVTSAEWTALTGRVTTLEGRAIGDLAGIDLSGIADGQTVIYDAGSGDLVAGDAVGTLAYVQTDSGSTIIPDVTNLVVWRGLDVRLPATSEPGIAYLEPIYGSSGTANTIARADHAHNPVLTYLQPVSATGVLSSGTRTLHSGNLGPLVAGVTYDVTATFVVCGRNNGDNGEVTLGGRVGTDGAYPTRSRTVPTVGGVPVDFSLGFAAVLTGAGATVPVTFTAQFASGAGTDLLNGEVRVHAHPRR